MSFSYGGTIKLVDSMSDSYDEDALLWSHRQEEHFKVIEYFSPYHMFISAL